MKNKKIFIVLVPVLCFLAAILSYFKFINNINDSLKFKNEYESINGKKDSNDKVYKQIKIDKNNPIKYSNYDEIIDIIKNKTGIIYLGYPECPWCRTAVPVLLDVAKDNNIDVIYYLNIKNERDSYTIENKKLKKEEDGTNGYFKLLKALDKYLSDYVILYDDEEYEVGEKRLYAPTVLFVKNGNVVGLHVSTVDTQQNPYEDLTKDEYEALYNTYEDYILELNDSSCSINSSC